MQVLEEIRARDQETPVFMITAYGSIEVAVDALKRGANDYFAKPWDNEKLLIEIERMISKRRLERENIELKRALKQRYSFPNIVGKSERMLKILDLVGAGCGQPGDDSDHGRNGNRERTDRQRDSRAFGARRASVCAGAFGLGAAGSAGIGAVRAREGRVHRSGGVAQGIFRDRQSRDDFLRRDRNHFAGDADQAAARDSGARVHAAGVDRNDQGGCADCGGDQRRSEEGWWRKGSFARTCTTG